MDLSKYLKSMKNLPDRFSNLAFWRGVRKLRDEMVDTFEYVGEWGTSVENDIKGIGELASQAKSNAMTALRRINGAFEARDVVITSTSPDFTTLYIPESEVPYPRVDQCIIKFNDNGGSTVSTSDIIESAFFTGMFNLDDINISYTYPVPLIPLYTNTGLSFLSPPLPLYKTSSSFNTSNCHFTIKVRCRRIPS